MRISLDWLKEYVDISGLSPEDIAEALTRSGLEVEAIDREGPRFDNVVIGRALELAAHPNADKLRLVTVDAGSRQYRVVCGAPNVREGLLIAFAPEGATVLNRKDGSAFRLGPAVIRGVESSGMICSIDELGLEALYDKTEDGIWPLDAVVPTAQPGEDLKTALGMRDDVILHVAPTANRGDLMSVMGVAREVTVLFDRPFHHPDWQPPSAAFTAKTDFQVSPLDPALCRYYGGVVMRNLKIGPSPDWMQRRLQAAGVRAINNVVDITNYVMLETGQPLHAFDLDKLGSGKISVRHARESETLTTLDGIERALTPEALLIAMNDRPVALAGVMGGADTEIDDASTALLLEAACFTPVEVRKSGRSVGLRSEAAARFERGVDAGNCRNVLYRAAALLKQYAGAEFIHLADSSAPMEELRKITLHYAQIEKTLGLPVSPEETARILKKLGFRIQAKPDIACAVVEVPSFRQEDVTREIDLIEEIIRIYGYDRTPYTLPLKTGAGSVTMRARMLRRVHEALTAQGLQEVVSTSLIGRGLLEKTGLSVDEAQCVSIVNSHSPEHTLMRQSLLPNLLEMARFNLAQDLEDIWIYELGRVYFKLGKPTRRNAGVSERLQAAGLLTGSAADGAWRRREGADFYLLKGVLENLFAQLRLPVQYQATDSTIDSTAHLHPGRAASILSETDGKPLGVLGELHPKIGQRLKFRQPVYLFELDVEAIHKALRKIAPPTSIAPLSPYPAIRRDMAFVAPDSLSHQRILEALTASGDALLREVSLFDEYRSERLGEDRRSLAYRLVFQSHEATLTDAEVDERLARLKQRLTEQLHLEFR